MEIDIKKGLQELYCFDTDGITDFYAEPEEKEDDLFQIEDPLTAYEKEVVA
jgi:hypothetical protein